MEKGVYFRVDGREAIRYPASGPVLVYTYPDQDPNIPKGQRRVSYLEPYEGEDK